MGQHLIIDEPSSYTTSDPSRSLNDDVGLQNGRDCDSPSGDSITGKSASDQDNACSRFMICRLARVDAYHKNDNCVELDEEFDDVVAEDRKLVALSAPDHDALLKTGSGSETCVFDLETTDHNAMNLEKADNDGPVSISDKEYMSYSGRGVNLFGEIVENPSKCQNEQSPHEPVVPVGTKVQKKFEDGIFEGTVLFKANDGNDYHILYEDGDSEDLTPIQLKHLLVRVHPKAPELSTAKPKGTTAVKRKPSLMRVNVESDKACKKPRPARQQSQRHSSVPVPSQKISPWTITCDEEMSNSNNYFLGMKITSIALNPISRVSERHRTFASHLFRTRLIPCEILMTSRSGCILRDGKLPDGSKVQLLATKVNKDSDSKAKRVTAYYVKVHVPGLDQSDPPLDLQFELSKLGAFIDLPPRKVASRLELLLSTARSGDRRKKSDLIFDDLTPSDFEEIEESANEGCGFIPKEYLFRFLGNRDVGQRSFAIQVRIIVPKLGIFKGVLCEKPGITKIQLPESMKKVGPSYHPDYNHRAALLINSNGVFPSSRNVQLEALLTSGGSIPDGFHIKHPCAMVVAVLRQLRVPEPVIESYSEMARRSLSRLRQFKDQKPNGSQLDVKDSFLIGLTDPTDGIPWKSVFVTGYSQVKIEQQNVFVTRVPCTEAFDGHVLNVVSKKPSKMSKSSWNWICSLPFGAIIFGKPTANQKPLPTLIANGDLDGDLYFTCWDQNIIKHIVKPTKSLPQRIDDKNIPDKSVDESKTNWFEMVQREMSDVSAISERDSLIASLYRLWLKSGTARAWETNGDVDAFGRAYKRSLEIGKHGGKVFLPGHLWNELPKCLHTFLTT